MITRAARALAGKGKTASAAWKDHAERQRTEQERLLALLDSEHAEALRRRMGEDGLGWDASRSVAPPR
jgi:uncharacterized caspase-like protein